MINRKNGETSGNTAKSDPPEEFTEMEDTAAETSTVEGSRKAEYKQQALLPDLCDMEERKRCPK